MYHIKVTPPAALVLQADPTGSKLKRKAPVCCTQCPDSGFVHCWNQNPKFEVTKLGSL